MGTIKTKPFDLEAIKNGAKWGIFGYNNMQFICLDAYNHVELLFSKLTCDSLAIRYDGLNLVSKTGTFLGSKQFIYQILLIQEPKLASDLSEVKAGDKVWDFLYEYGTINHISESAIVVKFNQPIGVITYNLNGTYWGFSQKLYKQSLFLIKIKFEIPEV